MLNTLRTKAIVLKRVNYNETDRIVKFITPNGEISALAKGVRKQGSKIAGGIEPFCLVDIVILKGKTNLYRLTSAKLLVYYENLIKDFDRMDFAYKIMKIISQSNDGVNDESWFNLLNKVLAALNNLNIDLRLIKSWFYIQLSDLLGETLNLMTDESGEKILQDEVYFYDSMSKGLIKSKQGNLTSNHIKLLRLLNSKNLDIILKIRGLDNLLDEVLLVAISHSGIE